MVPLIDSNHKFLDTWRLFPGGAENCCSPMCCSNAGEVLWLTEAQVAKPSLHVGAHGNDPRHMLNNATQ
uniref:Uncharacterized protein n=1 Tax=Anguilla anguilla TaxID=7936 RepID=A0A0E9W8N9_ANGAN